MSFLAKVLYYGFKISGYKKIFALPEDKFLEKANYYNKNRDFFIPSDHKFIYAEHKILDKYSCLSMQQNKEHSKKAILYFFGGGMMIGPDAQDVAYAGKICKASEMDLWFPFYPLCTNHCITETFEMAYECYKEMVKIYGEGNVSTCGLSSGGALALGIATHNNALGRPISNPYHIVVSSPGECPHNEDEKKHMQELNKTDVLIDYRFMSYEHKFMEHGNKNVPNYMLSGSLGNYAGVHDIHFFYSEDEMLYAACPYFIEACKKANVPYTVTHRKGMVHCYVMAPYFKEAKEDFNKMIEYLKA